MDQKVLQTQQWLNQTYGNNPNFVKLTEDGIVGQRYNEGINQRSTN